MRSNFVSAMPLWVVNLLLLPAEADAGDSNEPGDSDSDEESDSGNESCGSVTSA
jgi:hypothetical protein